MTNPIIGIIRTLLICISGQITFDETAVNKQIKMDDGIVFTIFRRVIIRTRKTNEPKAYFLVRFKPNNMTPEENIKFSRRPMLVFMGFTGFRTKYWAVDYKTGLCQGLYEWQTVEDAENYSKSIAMRFMAKRSSPDSIMFKIIDRSKEELKYEII